MVSEKHLIARVIANGDPKAFEILLKTHQTRVRIFLVRLTQGNQILADDLAQEVFLNAYSNLSQFRSKGTFSAWLHTIAYRDFLRHVNQSKTRKIRDKVWLESQNKSQTNLDVSLDLEKAFAKLKSEERSAITLCYSLGYTNEEAAKIMNIPQGTLKSHIKRGREKLAEDLKHLKKEKS